MRLWYESISDKSEQKWWVWLFSYIYYWNLIVDHILPRGRNIVERSQLCYLRRKIIIKLIILTG